MNEKMFRIEINKTSKKDDRWSIRIYKTSGIPNHRLLLVSFTELPHAELRIALSDLVIALQNRDYVVVDQGIDGNNKPNELLTF